MGMIVTIPDDIRSADCLAEIAAIFARVEPDITPGDDPALAEERLPEPRPAATGTIQLVDFPHQNPDEPGLLVFGWPPLLEYDNNEGYILELLVDNIASGETSDLYGVFIDSQTRVLDIGANSVFAWTTSDQGHPFYVGFNNVKREMMSEAKVDYIRSLVLAEIQKVADLADGSEDLRAFNERARNRVAERRRDLRQFLNSPPGFGFRRSGGRWMSHLKHLRKTEGFHKSLSLKGELAFAENLLAQERNFWREYIERWKLVDRPPYAVGARPDPDLLARSEAARAERIEKATAALQEHYGLTDREAAISRFKEEYDAKTAEIDELTRQIEMPKFVENPPLTLDEQLRYTTEPLPGGGRLVTSTFDNITGATLGLAFRMNVVPEPDLVYVPALPILLTEVGVVKDGTPMAYDEMMEAIRREILELNAYYSVNHRNGRVELVLRVAGTDADESQLAMDWLETVLFDQDWRVENLPRIRDAVDVSLSGLRNTMRRREEAWVNNPASAYWRQDDPLILSADCFLTETHAMHRLRWMLKDAGSPEVQDEFAQFMTKFARMSEVADRDGLSSLLSKMIGEGEDDGTLSGAVANAAAVHEGLSTEARELVTEAARDLRQSLSDIPDLTLGADWSYLCDQMTADLAVSPEATLARIGEVLSLVRKTDNVRSFLVASSAEQERVKPRLRALLGRMEGTPSVRQTYADYPRIVSRLRERHPDVVRPIFVGLVNENTRSGVVMNSTECASYLDHDREGLLRFVSSRLYAGGGAHSMFMKTWGAGLAYSNGLGSSAGRGRLNYYAERCPDLAQTVEFVVNELKSAPDDSALAEYALAQVFGSYRAGSRYEARGEAMASDLEDGITPEVVRDFRTGVLELRDASDLYRELSSRMESTYGGVLPGYGAGVSKAGVDAVSFIIGPEKQFQSYESYLQRVEGAVPLYRLFPRDFWVTAGRAERLE
jgi:hypothetical protein